MKRHARKILWAMIWLVAVAGIGIPVLVMVSCQASTRIDGAQSKAERTTKDDRGFEEWEVIVLPPGAKP